MILNPKIKKLLLISLIYFGFSQIISAQAKENHDFITGADQPELYLDLLKGKKVIIVANQTSLLKDKTHLVDFLVDKKIDIKSIFAPEHGFRGDADAGEHVKSGIDTKTGLPIISLYGNELHHPFRLADSGFARHTDSTTSAIALRRETGLVLCFPSTPKSCLSS